MEFWKAGNDVMKIVRDLIAKYHPNLALIEDEIAVIFKEKAAEKSGVVILGATRRAPPILPVLTDKKFTHKFIIEIGADWWDKLDSNQRKALLDHHLCSIRVEEDEQTGTMKLSLRPPDFVGYTEEVKRWGMWRPLDTETLTVIEEMFGKKAEEVRSKPIKRSEEESPEEESDVFKFDN